MSIDTEINEEEQQRKSENYATQVIRSCGMYRPRVIDNHTPATCGVDIEIGTRRTEGSHDSEDSSLQEAEQKVGGCRDFVKRVTNK